MNKYKLKFSRIASKDLDDIYNYINDNLKEHEKAEKIYDKIRDEIKKLEYFPKRHQVIKLKDNPYNYARMLIIDNYIVFYIVREEEKVVSIRRILYGASNWEKEL